MPWTNIGILIALCAQVVEVDYQVPSIILEICLTATIVQRPRLLNLKDLAERVDVISRTAVLSHMEARIIMEAALSATCAKANWIMLIFMISVEGQLVLLVPINKILVGM